MSCRRSFIRDEAQIFRIHETNGLPGGGRVERLEYVNVEPGPVLSLDNVEWLRAVEEV